MHMIIHTSIPTYVTEASKSVLSKILASSLTNTGYHETPFPELAIHDTNILLAYSDALHMWYKDM